MSEPAPTIPTEDGGGGDEVELVGSDWDDSDDEKDDEAIVDTNIVPAAETQVGDQQILQEDVSAVIILNCWRLKLEYTHQYTHHLSIPTFSHFHAPPPHLPLLLIPPV